MSTVFVSHRIADSDAAERLAVELKRRGHEVWLDAWSIDVGDSIVERMNYGLEGAAYLILCYSSSGSTSSWMTREWMSALARQLNGEHVKVLPVRLTGGSPPALLADIKYVDATEDWRAAVDELCALMG